MLSWYGSQCRALLYSWGTSGDISVSGLIISSWRDIFLIFSETDNCSNVCLWCGFCSKSNTSHFYAKYESWIIINYFLWCSKSSVIYVNAYSLPPAKAKWHIDNASLGEWRSQIWSQMDQRLTESFVFHTESRMYLMLTRSTLYRSGKNLWQLLKERCATVSKS